MSGSAGSHRRYLPEDASGDAYDRELIQSGVTPMPLRSSFAQDKGRAGRSSSPRTADELVALHEQCDVGPLLLISLKRVSEKACFIRGCF